MRVVDLKALAKEYGLRGYFKVKNAELITFLRNRLGLDQIGQDNHNCLGN